MNNKNILTSVLVCLIFVSFVSAGWFSNRFGDDATITGNAVQTSNTGYLTKGQTQTILVNGNSYKIQVNSIGTTSKVTVSDGNKEKEVSVSSAWTIVNFENPIEIRILKQYFGRYLRLSVIESRCIDSDGGLNYYEYGYSNSLGDDIQFKDKCEGENILLEFVCDRSQFVARYDCSSEGKVCRDGACVEVPLDCSSVNSAAVSRVKANWRRFDVNADDYFDADDIELIYNYLPRNEGGLGQDNDSDVVARIDVAMDYLDVNSDGSSAYRADLILMKNILDCNLLSDVNMGPNSGNSGGGSSGGNGTSSSNVVTYQGVLEMLGSCISTRSDFYEQTGLTKTYYIKDVCNAYNEEYNKNTYCIFGQRIDLTGGPSDVVPCESSVGDNSPQHNVFCCPIPN